MQNAGLALGWALRVLGLGWSDGLALARTVPDGAGGVTFLPFLTGERGGVAGPDARGAWTGLREDTGRPELVRAAVEGMVFAVAAAVDLLDARPRPRSWRPSRDRPGAVRRASRVRWS